MSHLCKKFEGKEKTTNRSFIWVLCVQVEFRTFSIFPQFNCPTYTVFRSEWQMGNLHNTQTTYHNDFCFFLLKANYIRFCHVKFCCSLSNGLPTANIRSRPSKQTFLPSYSVVHRKCYGLLRHITWLFVTDDLSFGDYDLASLRYHVWRLLSSVVRTLDISGTCTRILMKLGPSSFQGIRTLPNNI